jgi:neutral ceramidase
MRAGWAAAAITPPLGTRLAGFGARTEGARGVHDDLYARVLALDDGDRRAAIVLYDLCELDAPFVAGVRERVEAAAGIAAASVMVAATHSHGAPATFPLLSETPDPGWLDAVVARAAGAAVEACERLAPVAIAAGAGRETTVGRNRRREDGPTDPAVTVVRFERAPAGDASPPGGTASLVHYGCHPTVLGPDNLLITRDYPGFTVDAVARATDGWAAFANGACGNVNVGHSAGRTALGILAAGRTFDRAEALGLRLAVEALHASATLRPVNGRLASGRRTLTVPLRTLPEPDARAALRRERERLEALTAAGASDEQRADARLELFYAEAALTWVERRAGTSEPTEVQAIAAGDLALVALPGEFFAESGLRLRERSPFPVTLPVCYANGCVGYVPPARAFEEGGYETKLSPWSRVGAGGEAAVLDAAVDLLSELRRAAAR